MPERASGDCLGEEEHVLRDLLTCLCDSRVLVVHFMASATDAKYIYM